MHQKQKTTIIGSGLAGSFLAVLLAQKGYSVDLYEKLSKQEISDTNAKRSYNITFRTYGVDMFKKAGIWNELKPYLFPLKGVSTQLSKDSQPIFSPVNDKKLHYFSISRRDLLAVLLAKLSQNPSVTIHYETSLISIDRYNKTFTVEDNKTKKMATLSCDVIVGADGANSLVRPFMQQGQHMQHSQEYSKGGYKQFTITKEEVETLQLQSNIAYTWSAKGKFILAFPNLDGSLAALLIYPEDKKAFEVLNSANAIKQFIQNDFPILLPIQQSLIEQLIESPVGMFVTIHTDPWYYKDFITIVGDAAHGFYPFFGQGASAAFGDCMQLVNLIDQYHTDWAKVFQRYQEMRKLHMDALGDLSREALSRYMRNKRADYHAVYDALMFAGHRLAPNYIQPPVFLPVMDDPEHTADYVRKDTKQKKIAQWLGVSLLAKILTKMVAMQEAAMKLLK
ncbi:MAG TPA: NAD(P)/FAD-dependent oxidoreductase [Candidatus Saccharimonadales bacterium]|nr:NAD(P)/FAD-dependent oxidoreductase [Candidatus Saccharimonadales bacterium]